MAHRILMNTTDKPMKHSLTGQTIMPGQSYAEPEEVASEGLMDTATDPTITVQTVADPESTKKATATLKSDKSGDK